MLTSPRQIISALLIFSLLVGCEKLPLVEKLPTPTEPAVRLVVGNDDNASIIYLSGFIDRNMLDQFKRTLDDESLSKKSFPAIALDSAGGDLEIAVELGKLLREKKASVFVGKWSGSEENEFKPAVCYSACNFVFIGGRWRYLDEDQKFGTHRFFSANQKVEATNVEQQAQAYSGYLLDYTNEMGISSEFLIKMFQQNSEDIEELSIEELRRMKIVNDGRDPPAWSHEVDAEYGFFTRGVQKTDVQESELRLFCRQGKIRVHFKEFNPRYAEKKVADDLIRLRFFNDGTTNTIPLSDAVRLSDSPYKGIRQFLRTGDLLELTFDLTDRTSIRFATADAVGLLYGEEDYPLQIDYANPTDRKIISEFLTYCTPPAS